jgi:CRP-like cAMP-binding protein
VYVVQSGSLDVYIDDENSTTGHDQQPSSSSSSKSKVGVPLVAGAVFGELALVYNTPRAATIVATSASTLWTINRSTFHSICSYFSKVKVLEIARPLGISFEQV